MYRSLTASIRLALSKVAVLRSVCAKEVRSEGKCKCLNQGRVVHLRHTLIPVSEWCRSNVDPEKAALISSDAQFIEDGRVD